MKLRKRCFGAHFLLVKQQLPWSHIRHALLYSPNAFPNAFLSDTLHYNDTFYLGLRNSTYTLNFIHFIKTKKHFVNLFEYFNDIRVNFLRNVLVIIWTLVIKCFIEIKQKCYFFIWVLRPFIRHYVFLC